MPDTDASYHLKLGEDAEEVAVNVVVFPIQYGVTPVTPLMVGIGLTVMATDVLEADTQVPLSTDT